MRSYSSPDIAKFCSAATRGTRKCLSQSDVILAILVLRLAQKHNISRGHWVLASWQISSKSVRLLQRSRKCLIQSEVAIFRFLKGLKQHILCRKLPSSKVSWNSIQSLQRRSQKFISKLETRAAIFAFWLARQKWYRILSFCLPQSFIQFLLIAIAEKKSRKFLSHQRTGLHLCFSIRPKKSKFGRGRWVLPLKFSLAVAEEKWTMSQPIRGHGGYLCFPIGRENITLDIVENIEYKSCFLSSFVKFMVSPTVRRRKEVSAIKRSVRSSGWSKSQTK